MLQFLSVLLLLACNARNSGWIMPKQFTPSTTITVTEQANPPHDGCTNQSPAILPFIATPEQQALQKLWESNPFDQVKSRIQHFHKNPSCNSTVPASVTTNDHHDQRKQVFRSFYHYQPPQFIERKISPSAPSKRTKTSYRIDFSYDGAKFCGWQRQSGSVSVQEVLEDTLAEWLGVDAVDVRVAGRTDAGVHAWHQVGRFRTSTTASSAAQLDALCWNPTSVSTTAAQGWQCWRVQFVSDQFHPTFQCVSRSYVYMLDRAALVTFCAGLRLEVSVVLKRLATLLAPLQGIPLDYYGLSHGKLASKCTVCCLHHVEVFDDGVHFVTFELSGDRFLRRMIRRLVSTVLLLSVHPDWHESLLMNVLSCRDRSNGAAAAPASGLVLVGASMQGEDEV